MSFDKSKHLERVLESHKMKHVQKRTDKLIAKREKVKDALDNKYSDKKATRAINSGSLAKHTAMNRKYDMDVCQPFKYDSFDTLEKMADDVYNFFVNEFKDDDFISYKTIKQRVSIGITFLIDGEEAQMDIVPGRELSKDDYGKTNRLNLHVRAKGLNPATSTQTNIQKHVSHISGKTDERGIIRLLKIWKTNSGRKLKSFFLELITIRAFENCSKKLDSLWEQLEMTMKYIRDNVETIRLEDPANSNNVVSNTMTDAEKKNLAEDMKVILKRIEEDDENIKIYFPVNDKYDECEDNKSSLGVSILSTKSFS